MTVLAVSPVVAVSVVTATPLKLNPPFRDPDCRAIEHTLKTQTLERASKNPVCFLEGC